jgi:hypothetical protein
MRGKIVQLSSERSPVDDTHESEINDTNENDHFSISPSTRERTVGARIASRCYITAITNDIITDIMV